MTSGQKYKLLSFRVIESIAGVLEIEIILNAASNMAYLHCFVSDLMKFNLGS